MYLRIYLPLLNVSGESSKYSSENLNKKLTSNTQDLARIERRRMKTSRSKKDRNSLRNCTANDHASSRRLLRGKANGVKDHREIKHNPRSVTDHENDANSSKNDISSMNPTNYSFAQEVVSRSKKKNAISLFDLLSNSEHYANKDMLPLYKDNNSLPCPSLASDNGTGEPIKMKKKDAMLNKMRTGLTASGKLTVKKATCLDKQRSRPSHN